MWGSTIGQQAKEGGGSPEMVGGVPTVRKTINKGSKVGAERAGRGLEGTY